MSHVKDGWAEQSLENASKGFAWTEMCGSAPRPDCSDDGVVISSGEVGEEKSGVKGEWEKSGVGGAGEMMVLSSSRNRTCLLIGMGSLSQVDLKP
jgi:hypothetical protein